MTLAYLFTFAYSGTIFVSHVSYSAHSAPYLQKDCDDRVFQDACARHFVKYD